MSSHTFLIDLALILFSTKLFGLLTKKFHMPQVVGALLAGILLGPACFSVIQESDFLSKLSSLGVIVIMFSAGMETNLKELKANGKTGFLVALVGVLLPLVGGLLFGLVFHTEVPGAATSPFLQYLFVGVILTATSVSITVETLKEIGRLNTKVGNCILAAALIDDILGLVCLTIISSMAGSASVSIAIVLLKILLFFIIAVILGLAVQHLLTWYSHLINDAHMRRFPVLAFVLCLFMAHAAEQYFGVADIIGAFAAGLVIGATPQATYVESRFRSLSYLMLTPIFFAHIGLTLRLGEFSVSFLAATAALIILSVLTKLVGCGLGAKVCGMTTRQSMQVGLGMVCRGEVALIIANRGQAMGLMPSTLFAPIIVMVVATAILTPVFLKLAFRTEAPDNDLHDSPLLDRVQVAEHLDTVSQWLLATDSSLKLGEGHTEPPQMPCARRRAAQGKTDNSAEKDIDSPPGAGNQ